MRGEAYRSILRVPGAPRLVLASVLGRIPQGIAPLATVLLLRQTTGSFAIAGVVAGAGALAAGLVAPLLGRVVDLRGQPRVLVSCAVTNALALTTLIGLALADGPVASMVAVAAIAGATIPPLSACMRALWSSLLEGPRLETAYAMEAVLVEVFYIAGPLLTAVLSSLASPSVALGTAAVLTLLGTLAFASSPLSNAWRGTPRAVGRAGALAGSGMRTLVATVAAVGIAFGTLEVALPAFAEHHGKAANGGVLLALMAGGSMAAGLWYGSREWRSALAGRYAGLSALFALGLGLLALAGSLPEMALLVALAGAAIAPAVTCAYALLDRLAPRGTVTEAYTWLTTANVAGSAAGTAVAGTVVEGAGVRWAFCGACAAAALAALITLARRRSLSIAPGI